MSVAFELDGTSRTPLAMRSAFAAAIMIAALARGPAAAVSPQSRVDTGNWTTADDHRNMMEQLGIKSLRPGPSGNEQAPNHANYDEALANPFPNLPPLLMLKNGRAVTTADVWRTERRPEIVEDFEREVLGRVPKNVPKVTWNVTQTMRSDVAGHPVLGKRLA